MRKEEFRMSMFVIVSVFLLCLSGAADAYVKTVTFYADGAMVEIPAVASKGVVTVPLHTGMIGGTLRVKPGKNTTIQRVDIIPALLDSGRSEKDLDALLEQKNRLGDRLQALATREEIFKSAAKSQSGKAPRKTKSNPDPMQSIRQGTEFAIAQLEAVYTAQRKTELEIKRLDGKIAAARKQVHLPEQTVRIAVSPVKGNVVIRYAVSTQSWTPHYDIYLNGDGTAQLALSGHFPDIFPGYNQYASLAPLAESSTARTFAIPSNPLESLTRYKLGAGQEFFGNSLQSAFSFELKNPGPAFLPAGEANVYNRGEYMGKVRFEGISSGRTRKISAGM
jgi:hypothetical protein